MFLMIQKSRQVPFLAELMERRLRFNRSSAAELEGNDALRWNR